MSTNPPSPPTAGADPRRTPGQGLTKEQAFQRLLEGHWRYLANNRQARNFSAADRQEMAEGQYPFAAFLGCADSRVSPDVIFDQGLGDLFVARVAGNILGTGSLASLEYAVAHLGVRLLVVFGHEHCGAVKAALATPDGPGAIGFLLREIAPAVVEARAQPGDLLENAITINLCRSAKALTMRSEMIGRAVRDGEVRIIGVLYRISTGDVDIKVTLG